MKPSNLAILIIAFFLILSGCDRISHSLEQGFNKGSLDAVVSCLNYNADKEDLLTKNYIKEECIKSVSKRTNQDLSSASCASHIKISGTGVSMDFGSSTCRNGSDHIITSVTTTVRIRNIPDQKLTSKLFVGTADDLFILPDRRFSFSTYADVEEEYKDLLDEEIPYCSDLEDGEVGICSSWSFGSFEYVEIDIR